MNRRVTLVAGGGNLVPHVARAIRERGDTLQVVDLVGRSETISAETAQIFHAPKCVSLEKLIAVIYVKRDPWTDCRRKLSC